MNNHVDVDGILSVYVLVHKGHALAHRRTTLQAAEIGDFWGWGEPPAQRLFQGITRLMNWPEFNEAISEKAVLWQQVRARRDAQQVCLVSIESG